MLIILLLLAYMKRDSEFAFAEAQIFTSRMNTDKPACKKSENVFFAVKGSSNDDSPVNESGVVDLAATERGYHVAPIGNDAAFKGLQNKMGVNGLQGEYAGYD